MLDWDGVFIRRAAKSTCSTTLTPKTCRTWDRLSSSRSSLRTMAARMYPQIAIHTCVGTALSRVPKRCLGKGHCYILFPAREAGHFVVATITEDIATELLWMDPRRESGQNVLAGRYPGRLGGKRLRETPNTSRNRSHPVPSRLAVPKPMGSHIDIRLFPGGQSTLGHCPLPTDPSRSHEPQPPSTESVVRATGGNAPIVAPARTALAWLSVHCQCLTPLASSSCGRLARAR